MRVLGLDPGSSASGYALLDVTRSPTVAHYVESGTTPHDVHVWAKLIARADVVAVEIVRGIAFDSKGAGIVPHLISASNACGGAAAIARYLGKRVVEMPAVDWRRALVGRVGPTESNSHERDAAGVALGVAWSELTTRRTA